MLIIVSGFAGSGKSTLTEKLAKALGLKFVHASDLLRQLKSKKTGKLDAEHTKSGSGWWESKEAEEYMKKRENDSSMDERLDKELLKIAEKGSVVLDSWTLPWLSKKGFKIWLEASAETRAKRVAERDSIPFGKVKKKIVERDKKTAAIYKRLYGFELGKDKKPFHLVIDTNNLNESQTFEIALNKIKEKMEVK
ncbi:MAG: cytidylate kinase family protein [Candidatus Diapherotrites archaeon]|uniref:AAA family ATPase n=1 Tax=Candidatus Iainarchaeum sp. TaxID=3101447 RepID=A0A7J4J0Q5_9ARCH|nr:MAG: cytidylate kinase [archaeon GW2011_AR10]MBS3059609.1 cytidylate kinase family protein [Candidatus Diapherotrites archaeon]HIH08806.1 AAA family ATPase [Candidatus Diapherotrites archaeon]